LFSHIGQAQSILLVTALQYIIIAKPFDNQQISSVLPAIALAGGFQYYGQHCNTPSVALLYQASMQALRGNPCLQ
jgi:hypothetical protein